MIMIYKQAGQHKLGFRSYGQYGVLASMAVLRCAQGLKDAIHNPTLKNNTRSPRVDLSLSTAALRVYSEPPLPQRSTPQHCVSAGPLGLIWLIWLLVFEVVQVMLLDHRNTGSLRVYFQGC